MHSRARSNRDELLTRPYMGFLEGLAPLDYASGAISKRLLALLQLPPAGIGPP